MSKKKTVARVAFAVVGIAVLATAIYIMANGLGLQDDLDFGAGAYYYADIPNFEKYVNRDTYTATLPFWVYVLLFLVWGALMYLLWIWVDKRGGRKK